MRIVIDMQGAQIETRIHGVGRYTMSFAQSAVLSRGEHQVILALSGLLPDTIEPIRAAFDGLLPQDDIRVWHAPGPADGGGSKNEKHCRVAELIREAFLASLRPDVIHISNLSDGLADHAVTSIGRFDKHTPVTVAVLQFSYARQGQEGDSDDLWRRRIAEVLSEAALCYVTAETESTVNDLGISADRIRKLLPESESDTGFQVSQIFDDWATVVSSSKDVAFRPTIPLRRPRLAYVSPLPPERTGIADYSAELLPALAEYYDIEVVVAQDQVTDTWVTQNLRVRDVAWLRAHEDEIDRVLYHIGNSQFHAHMLTLLKDVPGVIVLHDFYLGHLWGWMDQYVAAGSWARELYSSHGYSSVRQRYNDTQSTVSDFPCSFGVLGDARGVIVHSEHSRKLERHWFGEDLSIELSVIPLLRVPVKVTGKNTAKEELGFSKDDFVICSFGFLGETKLNHRLIDSWLASVLPQEEHCHLVFVGENDRGEYGAQLLQRIKTSGLRKRIRITGYASPDLFRRYLRGADLAVQLRTKSRGETSAAVLDCMNYGLPLIVNANGSMAELDRDAVWMLSDDFDDHELIEALEGLWREPEIRHTLGRQASAVVHDNHSPAQCAKRYAEAIENSHRRTKTATKSLLRALASHELDAFTDTELLHLSRSVAATFPVPRPAKRLFLDVSATCRNDLKTGIERVARALLLSFMDAPPSGYRIEPVYLDNIGGEWLHRHARRYTLGLLECPVETLDDDILEPECGDILLVLDLSGDMVIQAQRTGLFGVYHNKGVAIFSIVFDLLPVQMPEMFPPGADQIHWRWLQSISGFSGVMCISKAVADGLAEWLHEAGVEWKNRRPCQIGWFHLGDDVASSAPSQGLPTNAESTIVQIRSRPSFLMVGTIEPRKGYLQTIEAFSHLWQEDVDVNLVIVGKEGWKDLPDGMRRDIPQTIRSLRNHRELHRRLFWLEGISDEYLEAVYASSTCLIAASYGEGFGLPLIEAAQHKLAIIARDIPVFREVGGEHAYYFHGRKPGDLANAVLSWLSLHANGKAPRSHGMRRRTWRESAEILTSTILKMKNRSLHSGVLGARHNFPDDSGTACKGEAVKERAVSELEYLSRHPKKRKRTLFVDVSVVARDDFKTGIQRAVRALTLALIETPPPGFRVEPVYLCNEHGPWQYRFARRFTLGLLNLPQGGMADEIIEAQPGDILLGLDLAGWYVIQAHKEGVYRDLQSQGIKVSFVVYDLIPVRTDNSYPPGIKESHAEWLNVVARADSAICISRSVADDLAEWIAENPSMPADGLDIQWFHLGADLQTSSPSTGLPENASLMLEQISDVPSFLMVGTLEPRKGHRQALDAFELLWASGHEINLVFVGKAGWMVEDLQARLLQHEQLGQRFHWLQGVSDEYLLKVYAHSTCLLAASEGEGFGLPLIEAARHGLPLIARDIPVFREVAGNNAFYFSGGKPSELADAIRSWLGLFAMGSHPTSHNVQWITWKESARQLADVLIPEGAPNSEEQRLVMDAHRTHSADPSGQERKKPAV